MTYNPASFNNTALPAGIICMWAGLLSAIPSGWALCNGSGGTPDLRSKFIKGAAAGIDPGATGGSNTASYTPAGTNATSTVTPLGTIAWPVGVPTASGAAVADHASHTHSVTSNVTVADHAAHTHTFTSSVNATSPDLLTVNTAAAGVAASGTTGNPNATMTHTPTNNAVTSGGPSATLTHAVTQPTVAWPAGVPTLSGSSSTVGAQTFTGTNASIDTQPVYYSLAYIQKT